MAEQVIYNIKVEGADQAAAALGKTEATLKAVNKQRNDLIKRQSEGERLSEKEQAQLTQLTQKQAKLKAEKQKFNQVVNAEQRLTNAQVGAYQKLNASLNIAKQKYKDLAAAGKANTTEGKKLLTQIQNQDKKLKDIDGSMGNYQRNVGDYKNQIIAAFGQMGIPVHRFNGLLSVQAGLQQKLTTATAGSSKAMRIFKVALISTGIGAIAVALGTLAAAFFSTQRGADAVNRVLIPLRTVFQRLWGVVQELSTGLVDAFTNPKQAISDLWQFLKSQLLNRLTGIVDQFKAVGSIIESALSLDWEGVKAGAKDYGNAVLQTATGVENAAEKMKAGFQSLGDEIRTANAEGKRLSEIKIELEKLAIVAAGIEGKLRRTFEEQRVILNDINRADAERLKAGESAIEASEKSRDLKLQELELLIEEQELKIKQNDTDREAALELAKLQAQRDEIEAQHLSSTLRIRNRMNAITKKSLSDSKKELETLNEFTEQILENIGEQAEALLSELEDDLVIEPDIVFNDEEIDEKLNEFVKKYEEAQKYIQQYTAENRIENIEKEFEKLEDMYKEGLIDEEKYQNALLQLHTKKYQIKIGIIHQFMAATASMFNEGSKAGKAFAILNRGLMSAQAAIDTYAAANKALASAPPPWNFIQMAAVIASGLANVAAINNVKFEQGGIIGGRPHSQGGTVFYGSDGSAFEAERGEFLAVVNKHDAQTAAAYSEINSRHGKKFASGGMVVPDTVATSQPVDVSQIESVIKSIINIPVVVNESDISSAQRSVKVAETKGDF